MPADAVADTGAPPASAPPPSGAGGLRALTLATVFAAAAGYVVLLVAARALGPERVGGFTAYWGLFFALGGVANGLLQEGTRAVRAAGAVSSDAAVRSTGRPLLLPAGAATGLALAVVVLASWPAWAHLGLPTHGGVSVLVLAVGIAGFSLQAAVAAGLSGTERWSLYAVLLAVDAALRLAVAGACWALGDAGVGFSLATVAGAATWLLLLAVSPGTRRAVRSALDVGPRRLARNTASAMLASAGTSALVTGFPLVVTATARDDDAAALVGTVIIAITLTRAPLLVPLTSFQSAVIVYFVERRAAGVRALLVPLAAVAAVGVVGAGAAWAVGPWLLRTFFDDEYELPGLVLAGLTLASVGTAALMVTGNAALAYGRHALYNAGWWVAVVASAVVLLTWPSTVDVRATAALLAGPGVGVFVHLIGLGVRGPRGDDARSRGQGAEVRA